MSPYGQGTELPLSLKYSPMLRGLRRRVLLGTPLIHRFAGHLPKFVKQVLVSITGVSNVHRYQDFRNPISKAALIVDFLKQSVPSHPQSVLDVGCNAGEITKYLNSQGFFTVGIDRSEILARVRSGGEPLALIPLEIDSASVPQLPIFDCVLLLSIHHQWIATTGDDATQHLVTLLARKSRNTVVIEFSCINEKYGEPDQTLFNDNDLDSVKRYATDWLTKTLPDFAFKCLGFNEEHPLDEPYRILFGGSRSATSYPED